MKYIFVEFFLTVGCFIREKQFKELVNGNRKNELQSFDSVFIFLEGKNLDLSSLFVAYF